jgi:hypothetical protein
MAWLSRNDLARSDKLFNDMLNSLANDDRAWGGDVNGGGYRLSNVILDGSGGFTNTLSPVNITQGPDSESRLELRSGSGPTALLRWALTKDGTAEGGANAGSNFALRRYDDAGNLLGTPLAVNRATGLITMGAQKWTGPIDGGGQTITNVVIPGAGAVASVFGRSGAVVATAGDYSAAQVTNAVSTSGSYADPVWITSLGWAKLTGVPATFPPSAHTHDAAAIVSGVIAPARLATGTPGATVYLRGDGIWATPSGGSGGGSQTPWTSDIDAAGFMLNNAGALNTSGFIRSTGTANAPTSGAGIELFASANNGYIQAYNRSAGALTQLLLSGNPLLLNPSREGPVSIGMGAGTYALEIASASFQALRLRGIDSASNHVQLRFFGTKYGNDTWSLGTDLITATGGTDFNIYSAVGGKMVATFMANGSVGIGTTAPISTSQLHVASTGNAQMWLEAGAGQGAYFELGSGPASSIEMSVVSGDYALGVYSGASQVFRVIAAGAAANTMIVQAGRVGLGVSPTHQLSVQGAGNTGSIITGNSQAATIDLCDTGAAGGNGGMVMFSAAGGAWRFAAIKGWATNGANNTQGDVTIHTRKAPTDGALTESARFSSNGDLNITGAYKVNGTPIGGGIATQRVVTGSRVSGTPYQNDTGKAMFVTVCASVTAGQTPTAYTDAANPPTTAVASTFASAGTLGAALSFFVLPGNWYKVTTSGSFASWIEWF